MRLFDISPRKGAVLLLASMLVAAAPGSHSHEDHRELFRDGMRRRDMGNWQEALVFFDEALKRESEEGERVKLYGRRRFPLYLPRFYVGEALFKIGDYSKALEMWQSYDEGAVYAPVLPEEQRAAIEEYREEFRTRHFPSAFEKLAGELLVTRASLTSLESYRNRVGPARWEEVESRVSHVDTADSADTADTEGGAHTWCPSEGRSRLDELADCLKGAETLLADSKRKQDYTLAREARIALDPVVFDLVALKQETERSALEETTALGGTLTDVIRSVYSSPGCPGSAIKILERTLSESGPAPSGSFDDVEDARLALVSAYVKCGDLKTAQRYVEGSRNDLRRIARAGVGARNAPKEAPSAVVSSPLYPESHALVVGISEYTDWPDLPGVARDVLQVSEVLRARGFQVEIHRNLGKRGLEEAIEAFLSKKGRRKDTQLLFYYAGHGEATVNYGNEIGMMVPADAPPYGETDRLVLMESSVSVGWLRTKIEMLQARHALFVFDSCFSGNIFDGGVGAGMLSAGQAEGSVADSRGVRAVSSGSTGSDGLIGALLEHPVRYFLTAGTAAQRVPDESVFSKAFVQGLQGYAPHGDDILSAEELSFFVRRTVLGERGTRQTPMYGPLVLSPRVGLGSFLFRVPVWTAALGSGRRVGGLLFAPPENLLASR